MFGHIINILLTELGRSVLATSVKILPYRPPARLIRAKFKILILNFAYVHSNSANLLIRTISPISFIFNQTFRHKKTSRFPFGKLHFVLGLLARDIFNHSYAPNKPLTQVLNPLCEKFSVISIVHDKLKHVILINGLRPIYIFVSVRPPLSWLVSSIGRALHGYHRGQGFESRTSLLAEVSHVRDLLAGKSRTSLIFFVFQAFFSQM